MFKYEDDKVKVMQQRCTIIIIRSGEVREFDYVEFYELCIYCLGLNDTYQKYYIKYFHDTYGVYDRKTDLFKPFDIKYIPKLCRKYYWHEIDELII